ncbi:MAG: nucleotidyltransferase family protein [Bdellovibrionales bacterium]|nr:nucleotidyltransferase family protein [Bdellovibrionales bacterium]
MSKQNLFTKLVSFVEQELFLNTSERKSLAVDDSLWELALEHQVASLMASSTYRLIHWQKDALREVYYLNKTQEIQDALKKQGIHVHRLKGSLLAKEYPRKGLRRFRDVDLLAHPKDLDAIDRHLKSQNYEVVSSRGVLGCFPEGKGNHVIAATKGVDALNYRYKDYHLEIHTSIIPKLIGNYNIEWRGRSSRGQSYNEDILAHLMFHATRHHFLFGLRHLIDIAIWINSKKPNLRTLEDKLHTYDLFGVAYPAWMLSHKMFPRVVPSPIGCPNKFTLKYTRKMSQTFFKIPIVANSLAYSPLPCVLMRRQKFRQLVSVMFGVKGKRTYEIGDKQPFFKAVIWYLCRPWQLFKRHWRTVLIWGRFMRG